MKLKVRASQMGRLMTLPRSKKARENNELSETAKSYVKEVAYSDFFGIKKEFSSKELEKGIICEQDSIDLLNLVEFAEYNKAEEFGDNGWLTGHPDILTENSVIDIKTAWSFETFPFLQKDMDAVVKKSKYEWQLRAYMMLFEKEESKIVYCLVDTPDELLSDFDNEDIHKVNHIEPNKRISCSQIFKRDKGIEMQMKSVYDSANEYYQEVMNELKNK